MRSVTFQKCWILLFIVLLSFVKTPSILAAENHDELFISIGDALMDTKDAKWESVLDSMKQFEQEWNSIKKLDSLFAEKVDTQLTTVNSTLKHKDQLAVNQALSDLSKAVQEYDTEQNPVNNEKKKEKVKQLFPMVENIRKTVETGDFTKANEEYKAFLSEWNSHELIVRNESIVSYGEIEKQSAFLRIAITQDPPNQQKALSALNDLKTAISNFLSGNVQEKSTDTYKLNDGLHLLNSAEKKIQSQEFNGAISDLNEFLTIWPMIEGEVRTKNNQLYNDIEMNVPLIISIISSKEIDTNKAESIMNDLINRIGLVMENTSYSAWDAALILLREGLEALLIIATLVAFLKTTNQANKQKWVWGGVAAGVFASGIIAVIINLIFSKITAASSREYIEGITGIVAVLMMLTVGAWLHNKTNIRNWNQYLDRQMKQAIATGSLFSFSLISFLSIFREGAETIIFYAGMAPEMSMSQLLLGIVSALLLLIVIGYIIIRYSVKIPIRLFFIIATLLIYFFAFKILGVSIHALQIANVIPTNPIKSFVFIQSIGIYPTFETIIPQAVLLVFIIVAAIWVKKHNRVKVM
ncbi:FTR1 family iron permease [Peribacillus loiseleuriae]|uniref:FTR1 family iron permease n=1 Tax=Peribacillus loiseleuriae TaxID=1679170 RepID=UPI003D01A07B